MSMFKREISEKIISYELTNDNRHCEFFLSNNKTIKATIGRGDEGAYQFKFADKNDAEKVLAWVKTKLTESEEGNVDLFKARVTPPKKDGQSYMFRLVGEDQWEAFKDLSIVPAPDAPSTKGSLQ